MIRRLPRVFRADRRQRAPTSRRATAAGGLARRARLSGFLAIFLAVGGAAAQESAPRLTFAGNGLVSFNLNAGVPFADGIAGSTDFGTVIDFSDSFLLVRLDQQLFDKDRAGVVIGFLFPDVQTDLGVLFFNQIQVFYNTRLFGGVLGRTRLNNFVVELPTLREEDLIEYGFVNNAFSNANNSEFSRYGNVLRAQLFQLNSRLVISGQVANWAVTDSAGERSNDFDVNGISGSVEYRLPMGIRYTGALRQAGLTIVSQNVGTPTQKWMNAIAGGAAINLTRNPLGNLEFRTQGVYNFGVGDLSEFGTTPLAEPMGRARAESLSLVGSLRFLSRPYQLERFQVAITGGYKNFVNREGSRFTIIPNVFFRLGQGVDVGLQYQYEQFDDALAAQIGRKRDHSVKLTMSFRFQLMFNDYFGERDDILNMEHGWIP